MPLGVPSSSGAGKRRAPAAQVRVLGRPLAPPRPLDTRLFDVEEHELPNGLKVRLVPDRTVPAVAFYTFFRVGSRNERPGTTGIAHLFEHMMFNGAAKYGPKEFDRLLEANGGHSNAFTSHDATVYYEVVAAEALDLVIDLESDRMRSLSITAETLANEREVVKEERRLSVENEVFGLLDEELFALAYTAHPYRWPVIGWMEDIDAIRREDCVEFFRTYYAPNNATLWLVGDLDAERTLRALADRYGDIPKGPPVPSPISTEPLQRSERRSRIRFPAHSEALAIGYKAPAGTNPDAPVLDVIQFALTAGEGGRLVRKLVYEKLVASCVLADYAWKSDPGLFLVLVALNPGVKAEKALVLVDAELARIAERGLTEKELRRAQGQLRSQVLHELATMNGRAQMLGTHESLTGAWRGALELPERYASVSPDDVRRVAQQVFRSFARSVVTLAPGPSEKDRVNPEGVHG